MKNASKLINNLPVDIFRKYEITLVYAKAKRATSLIFHCYEKENTLYDDCENKINNTFLILASLNLPFYLPSNTEKRENPIRIYVGKNKKWLGRIINAKTSEEFGKCYSIPKTAIKALGDENKRISLTSFIFPEKSKHLECFLQFVPSKNHLKREIKKVKHHANVVKKFNPELHNFLINN